jgi:Domain of unknown function (DUF4375)
LSGTCLLRFEDFFVMAYESDPIAQKLNDLVNSQEYYVSSANFDELTAVEQVLGGTWELVNEVYNGGFTQYFHNSSRDHAKSMVAVLRSIDAHRAATILEAAIVLAGPGTPYGDAPGFMAAIKSMPEEVKKNVRKLERDLYDELDNLHLQVFRFLSKHRDQIKVSADFWTTDRTE